MKTLINELRQKAIDSKLSAYKIILIRRKLDEIESLINEAPSESETISDNVVSEKVCNDPYFELDKICHNCGVHISEHKLPKQT